MQALASSFFMTVLALSLGACRSDAPPEAPPFPRPEGERIVFFGDSITQAGDKPGGYVSLVRDSLQARYPEQSIEVIGAGISGNKVPDLLARVENDVLAHDPTTVVIYIGINDVWHWSNFSGKGTTRDEYTSGLGTLVDTLQASGARVLLCTPSVIGEKTGGLNEQDEMLDEYADISRQVAAARGAETCDLRADFLAHLEANNPDTLESGILTTDGVHLNERGNRFVAEQMLAALHDQR